MNKKVKVSISMRALLQRINRTLAKDGQVLKKSRSEKMICSVGEYFIVDLKSSCIICQNENPIDLGKKIGALKPYEEVSDEE